MVLKMRFENPNIEPPYVKDLETRECYECSSSFVCKHKERLEDMLTTLPKHNLDMGIVRAWFFSWAVFCPYFKPEEVEE